MHVWLVKAGQNMNIQLVRITTTNEAAGRMKRPSSILGCPHSKNALIWFAFWECVCVRGRVSESTILALVSVFVGLLSAESLCAVCVSVYVYVACLCICIWTRTCVWAHANREQIVIADLFIKCTQYSMTWPFALLMGQQTCAARASDRVAHSDAHANTHTHTRHNALIEID